MGWWDTNEKGQSFIPSENEEMVWGDGPADILDDAISQIISEFQRVWDRKPTLAEMRAGFIFSVNESTWQA